MVAPSSNPSSALSEAQRAKLLQALVALALKASDAQLDGFKSRLADALRALSEQPVRTDETEIGRHAFQHLSRNGVTFRRLVFGCLQELLLEEIRTLADRSLSPLARGAMDLSLVTFEAMENKVLIDNIGQAIEAAHSEAMNALNLRMAHLLQREETDTAHNPFRPEIFLKAVSNAWCKFDLHSASHRVVLRQIEPATFVSFAPILQALNDVLIAHQILPDLAEAYRQKKAKREALKPIAHAPQDSLHARLQRLLQPNNHADTGAPASATASISPPLLHYLNRLQQQLRLQQPAEGPIAASANTLILRQLKQHVPSGVLSAADANAIELLAAMFEQVINEPHVPVHLQPLLGRLQIPVLKAALADKDFFFRDDHPVRQWMDAVTKSALACDQGNFQNDPLYKMIEQLVDRVQQEYDQQIGLFDEVTRDLHMFIANEEQTVHDKLQAAIAEAVRQERIFRAHELAAHDVAIRIETSEVPQFIQVFLKTQWIRVLALAHSVRDTKPEALQNALNAMDDLIWSVQPKAGSQQRKELVSKLPAMLSLLNAWLNVIKWDGPDRIVFFSTLAERHATLVRASNASSVHTSDSPVHAAEVAVTPPASTEPVEDKPVDKYVYMVDSLEPGRCLAFARDNGATINCRLAWVSPDHSRFIFVVRPANQVMTLTADTLAQLLRVKKASLLPAAGMVDRALANAVNEIKAA